MTYQYLLNQYDAYPFGDGEISSFITTLDIPSPELGDQHRDVIVYLPAEYYLEPERRFGVLYMQDGHNIFAGDPMAPYGTWDVDQTVEWLVSQGEIEPIIIVGIQAINRFPEYTTSCIKGEHYKPLLKAYAHYVIHHVKPMIDNHFRTIPDAQHSAFAGSSLGGLSAFRIVWDNPYVFGKVAAFSPSTWVGSKEDWETSLKDESMEDLVNRTPREIVPRIKIYLDNGTIYRQEETMDRYPADSWYYTDRLRNALICKGYAIRYEYLQEGAESVENLPIDTAPENVKELAWSPDIPEGYSSWHDYLRPDLDLCHLVAYQHAHCEWAWKQRFANALRFLYNDH